MRVVGHMAMAYRDLARFMCSTRQLGLWIQIYGEMIETLKGIDTTTSQFADEIRVVRLYQLSEIRLFFRLSSKGSFPNLPKESLMHWRIEDWKLAQNPLTIKKRSSLQEEIKTRFAKPTVSAIDDFDNFTDRHKLRTNSFVPMQRFDPLLPSDLRWGYWRPEIQRQANALLLLSKH